MTGTLYVVATPIGNLDDLSPRARETLENVSLVLAEDTRRSGKLLAHFGLKKPLVSLFEHNEPARVASVVSRLEQGDDVALISDAGTPSISDPGYRLLHELRSRGLRVSPVPGPSSVLAALSVCGLPTDRFTFLGFPPKSGGKRKRWLEDAARREETVVLFLTAQRLDEKLLEIQEIFGDREATLCRELTKLHEEILPMGLSELAANFRDRDAKGEITLVIEGRTSPETPDEETLLDTVEQLRSEGVTGKRLASELMQRFDLKRNEAYKLAHEK